MRDSNTEKQRSRKCVRKAPLWSVTTWDKKFNTVAKGKQKTAIKYNYLLAADLESKVAEGGTIKLLTTYPSDLWSSEALVGDIASEGEVVSIPGGGNANVQYFKGRFVTTDNRIATSSDTSVLDNKYLYYFMLGKQRLVESCYRGVSIKHPEMGKVLDIEIPLPPLAKQREIAGELDRIVGLKKVAAKVQEKLQLLVKSRFVEMFGDLVTNEKEWRFYPLGEICDVRDGTHASPKYHLDGFPLMTSKNFTSGIEDFSDVKLISKEDFDEINRRSKVDVGDIVMPMIGTIGHPVIIKSSRPFAIKNVSLIKFTGSEFVNVFIKAVLDSAYFAKIIQETNRGNTQKFIALNDIRALPIPNAPLALQREFAGYVEKVEKLEAAAKKAEEKLDLLYRSKLQEYFA